LARRLYFVSTKDLVTELMRRLPDEISLVDIAREIEFVAGTREGIGEFDAGNSVSPEQLLSEIPQWAGNTQDPYAKERPPSERIYRQIG